MSPFFSSLWTTRVSSVEKPNYYASDSASDYFNPDICPNLGANLPPYARPNRYSFNSHTDDAPVNAAHGAANAISIAKSIWSTYNLSDFATYELSQWVAIKFSKQQSFHLSEWTA